MPAVRKAKAKRGMIVIGQTEEYKDNLYEIEQAYKKACEMSCRPDASFVKVKTGDVIDEEKSVRWNREEVERLQNAYSEEVKRLNREKNKAIGDAADRAIKYIANELNISFEKATVLWDFIYERHHAYGEMFNVMDDYIYMVMKILD